MPRNDGVLSTITVLCGPRRPRPCSTARCFFGRLAPLRFCTTLSLGLIAMALPFSCSGRRVPRTRSDLFRSLAAAGSHFVRGLELAQRVERGLDHVDLVARADA